MMDEKLLSPCGSYCAPCPYFTAKKTPKCLGCDANKGQMFWGECRVYPCAAKHKVEHCGVCGEFPCDLLVGQFDPELGPKDPLYRAGLLAYRTKHGTQKYIELHKKLEI